MYENINPYLQSELDYRRDRIRSSAADRKTRHHRIPRLRRASTTAPDAR